LRKPVRLGAELEFSNSLAGSYKVEMKDLKERAVRGGFAKLCAQAANLVIRVGSLVVLARLLNPTDFGLVAMVTAVTGLLNLFRDQMQKAPTTPAATNGEKKS